VEKAMNAVADALADSADSADDMSDGVDDATASALELQNAITPIISKMDELSQAYADAYKSAEDSLSGQFELFEQVDDIQLGKQWVNEGGDKKKSDESMREALESQAKYFEEYNSMLQQAQSIGINMDLLSQLADGSRESAETLKYITEGYASGAVTAEDINSLNGSYERLTDAKTDLAQTMADVETNYTTTMDNLQSELESTIGEMDMSTEAAEASRSTFQAMADEADDMLPTVRAAYQRIAAAAQAALDSIHMPEISVPGTGDGVDGHAAGGTRNAMPGLYQVGEHGPELMWMNGGEQVFTAQQTAAILANANNPAEAIPVVGAHYMGSDGSSYVVTLSPVYNISGSANALEIETILKQHDADLIETVKNELADMEVDKARRSYT